MLLAEFDALPVAAAEKELLTCCAAPDWAARTAAARPFGELASLVRTAESILDSLDWSSIETALSAHPRIGERAGGAGREAAWSRQEQAGAADAGAGTAAALVEANHAYEERFGHVFLICATGRSAEEMLAQARERLANGPDAERAVVRRELAAITRLRLEKMITEKTDAP